MADNRKLAQGLRNLPASAQEDLYGYSDGFNKSQLANALRSAGEQGVGIAKSVARGVPQMATGFVDAAALPLQWAGMIKPGEAVGSTKWLEEKGYLPPPQEGFVNQTTELLSGGFDPSDLMTKGLPLIMGLGKTVWHGSPHSFEKFDLSKIGTGEGAQAYGHGLYFAEKPEIARSYQESLSTGPERFLVNGEEVLRREAKGPMLDVSDPKTAAIVYASREGDKGARKYFKTQGSWGEKAIAELDAMKGQTITNELPGSLYKVDLPDEQIAKMLDWDKPLSSDAPQEVKDAFNGMVQKYPELKDQFFAAFREGKPGSHYYSLLNDYAKTGDLAKNQQFASEALREAGIPGIQYFDAGSRDSRNGTRNYVVFSDEIPQILERNNQVIK